MTVAPPDIASHILPRRKNTAGVQSNRYMYGIGIGIFSELDTEGEHIVAQNKLVNGYEDTGSCFFMYKRTQSLHTQPVD